MKAIFPNKLKKGDTICVIAPAASVSTLKPIIQKTAIKRVNNILGCNVVFGKNSFKKDIFDSSSIDDRIHDLHMAFKDKKIKGIICTRGGFNSNELLKHIDWTLVKNNPKPLCGYSDITVLSNAIYAKTGVVSYSGPTFSNMGMKDGKDIMKYTFDYFQKCLMSNNPFTIVPGKYFNERKIKATKNNGFTVIQDGNTKGTIIGGNLCSFNLLQGTEYMPSLKDKILFLEDDDFGGKLSPLEFERNFQSLLQCKDADKIKGIVFGRFQKGFNMNLEKMKFILSDKNISKSIPIIYNVDFGHTMPMITFPIGGEVSIEAKGKNAIIEITKH